MPSTVVYGVVEDHSNNLWVSTNNGLAKISPDLDVKAVYRFSDGLQANEFNPGAAFKSSDGLVFFGGINGFSVFRPELIRPNSYIPPVILSSFTQNREEIPLETTPEDLGIIELKWPRNYFEFKLSDLNFIQRDKNRIAFRLEPLENDWTITNSNVHQAYENLDGGTYTLLVKGSNNDGIWGGEVSALTIEIMPPFWERRGVQMGGGLAILLLLIAGVQLRVRNVQKYTHVLEKEVNDRTSDIEKRRKLAEGLREILLRINSNLSLAEILDFVVCQTTKLAETGLAFIFTYKNNEPEIMAISVTASISNPSMFSEINLENLVRGWDRNGRKPKNEQEIGRMLMPESHDAIFSIIPVLSANSKLGGLAVLGNNDRRLNEDELDLLRSLADQAALAMENDRLRKATEEMAVITERNRIARDLHDAITQTLFSANLIAESLPHTIKVDRHKGEESLKNLQSLNKSALAEMRALLLELRPSVIKNISLTDLLIKWLIH